MVTTVGTNANVLGGTVAVTVGVGGVPAGTLIVVAVCERSASGTSGTVADSAGNTYTSIVAANLNASAALGRGTLFYVNNATALVNGDTVTYTKNASGVACAMSVCYATGIDKTSPLDTSVTASATASTTTPTVTSGTPVVAGELFIGALLFTSGSPQTFSQGSGFTTPPDEVMSGTLGSDARVDGGNLINSGTGTETYAPTLTLARSLAIFIVGFKPALDPGVTWFQPPDQNRPAVKFNGGSPPAIALTPPISISSLIGVPWANLLDVLPISPPKQQPSAALSLAPTTLPTTISGMAWFKQSDIFQQKKWFNDQPAQTFRAIAQTDPSTPPGSGKRKYFPSYIPQPAYDAKKRAPVQPIWDRYRKAKQDEERARLDALARLPVPMPPASLFPAPQPVSYPQPTQFAPPQVERIAQQSQDAQDIADLHDLDSVQSQDVSDLQDVTDIMNLIGLE